MGEGEREGKGKGKIYGQERRGGGWVKLLFMIIDAQAFYPFRTLSLG